MDPVLVVLLIVFAAGVTRALWWNRAREPLDDISPWRIWTAAMLLLFAAATTLRRWYHGSHAGRYDLFLAALGILLAVRSYRRIRAEKRREGASCRRKG